MSMLRNNFGICTCLFSMQQFKWFRFASSNILNHICLLSLTEDLNNKLEFANENKESILFVAVYSDLPEKLVKGKNII